VPKKKIPHKPKSPPLAIPLPFDRVVDGLLKTPPSPPKKKPVAKKATGKRKK
jgi:hypothetical protein